MKNTIKTSLMSLAVISLLALTGCGADDTTSDSVDGNTSEHIDGNTSEPTGGEHAVSDATIAGQRASLAASIIGETPGAQAPRDIDSINGDNNLTTTTAPASTNMQLCDIHFHKSAEHKGGEFTTYAGNGDGLGYGTGYKYSGTLTDAEFASYENVALDNEHNALYSGDTIEVHYVYSDNNASTLGNGLGTCLGDVSAGEQPLLRVEARVFVLVNDGNALDFKTLNTVSTTNGYRQADAISSSYFTTLAHTQYEGSTTGPDYNEKVSPYQVSWDVSPEVQKVNIATVATWLESNEFDEDHAHAVRNLVTNPALLSQIVAP